MEQLSRITQQLEHYYLQTLNKRMAGIPVVNSRLQVAALEFQPWQQFYLGVMTTPWFMNLMLLPASEEAQRIMSEKYVGDKYSHLFPSGVYEFTQGYEASIGYYQSCSLFSPMFDFPDQETAVTTAHEIINALMEEKNRETLTMRETEVKQAWQPADSEQSPATTLANTNNPTGPRNLSRRQLLTGASRD